MSLNRGRRLPFNELVPPHWRSVLSSDETWTLFRVATIGDEDAFAVVLIWPLTKEMMTGRRLASSAAMRRALVLRRFFSAWSHKRTVAGRRLLAEDPLNDESRNFR